MSAVLVIGAGVLADIVSRELSPEHEVVRQADVQVELPESVDLALVLHDDWRPAVHQQAEEVFQPAGIPWLRGFVALGMGVMGPLVRPGASGCSQCADFRRWMAGADRPEMWQLKQQWTEHGGPFGDPWASRAGLVQVAKLVLAEARCVLEGRPSRAEGHIYLVHLKTLRSSRHFFLANPLCPVCGQLPDDSPARTRIALTPSLKLSPDGFRCRPLDELKLVLEHDYLDGEAGLLNGKVHDLGSPFAVASVNLPLVQGDEPTAGRTLAYDEAELTAILEALERYCGLMPRGKRTVVRGTFRNLAANALDPATVGLHAPEQYTRPDFPFKPYHPDRELDWVWGYSFLHERPILVPQLLAYYSLGCGDGFVYETSNGCALGGSLVEAIFHGILEVVERDAFLLTWYAKLRVPRLDPNSIEDAELHGMIHRFEELTGYQLYFYNITMENRIPSVWVMAKNRRPGGANLVCAAGAHLDPIRAVKSALHELTGTVLTLDERYEASRVRCLEMYRDPFCVRTMEDHSLLYSLPQSEERFSFLLDGRHRGHSFSDAFPRWETHADLTEDLKDVLDVFRRLQLDVIVVDQTAPELKRNGLYCVKVLIPGMLPMTFGYHLTRLEGLERVLRVPSELGYTKRPLKRSQLNPHPHPFP
jgi:ribosomal protein S12 methylthiotransferase accessory factor